MPLPTLPPVLRTVLGASLITTLGTLPVFLLGSQSVYIRRELDFDESAFGVAVGVFFSSAAVAAVVGGRLVDRLGRRRSTVLAGLLAAAGGVGVAWVARSWLALVLTMVVLGAANAACQVTANLTMARAVPPHRRGLGFGVKQAAIPLAIMIAGIAVPTVSVSLGWRWTFAFTAACGVAVAVAGLRLPPTTVGLSSAAQDRDRPPTGALVIIMLAIALASAAANSLGSFVASWGFQVGLTPGEAGVLMAVGSGANLLVRVLAGHLADRRHGRNLPVVAVQMFVGAVSLVALSFPSPYAVVPAGLVAFALGWSWPGLLLYAVVRLGRDAPGSASGIVQAGAFMGGAAGPVMFGAAVAAAGYETAWRAAGLVFLAAALLILLARRMFIADLVARPPVHPFGYGGGRDVPARTTSSSAQDPEGDRRGRDDR
jgi:MFS family permease